MKRLGYLLLPILAITLVLGGNAFAQDPIYFVTYYSNANTTGAPDAALRIINDGASSTAQLEGVPNGVLYASIYVFDDSEEMQECCNCKVTPDGLLSESVNKQLTANELTGRAENTRGVIKVIGSKTPDATNNVLGPGLHGWMTQILGSQVNLATSKWSGPFVISQTDLAPSALSAAELAALQESCSLAITLGSGYGTCTCTPEDHDF